MSKTTLFDPYDLNGLQLQNRMVMAPMTRSRAANAGHVATALQAEYYAQRATAGLIITEGTFISKDAVGVPHVPGIYSKDQVAGWRLSTSAVHEKGGKIFAQLWHTGAYSHPDHHNGEAPLAPSSYDPGLQIFTPTGFQASVTSRAMTLADIGQTVADFIKGAVNAFDAGFDGVELHAANGYLLQQFFSKNINSRTDKYGGSAENRARILFDILDGLKETVDIGRVGVRLNPSLNGIMGISVDDETILTYDYIVRRLNDYGLAYVHLIEPFTDVTGNKDAVQEVAKHFRKVYSGTIIINRGFTQETAMQVLEGGDADLVSFGALFLANPDLPERFKTGAALTKPDQGTFYTPGEKGYTDYPALSD